MGDIGSHWLDLAGFVGGRRIEAVMADLTTAIPTRLRPVNAATGTFSGPSTGPSEPVAIHTEDIAGVLIRFEGGTRGVLTLSQVSPGRKNHLSFEVSGSTATPAPFAVTAPARTSALQAAAPRHTQPTTARLTP